MVILEQVRVRRSKPSHGACDENDNGRPLVDGRGKRLVSGPPCSCDIDNAGWEMCDEEGEEDDGYPKLFQGNVTNLCFVGWKEVNKRSRPNLWAEVARHAYEEASKYQSLCKQSVAAHRYMSMGTVCTCGSVEIAKIQRVGMVCLPGGEEHG